MAWGAKDIKKWKVVGCKIKNSTETQTKKSNFLNLQDIGKTIQFVYKLSKFTCASMTF